jgi:hypothetical protein
MLLWIKIGVFYGVPVLAVLLAIVWFIVLIRRARRGTITRGRAAGLYALTLLLPIAAVLVVWATAELSSYFAVGSGGYAWDLHASLDVLVSLLPIALYVGAPIVLLVATFCVGVTYLQQDRLH